MAIAMDSTRIDACKTDDFIVPELFPEYPAPRTHDEFRRACTASGVAIDHVYRVIETLDAQGGRRELGNLVAELDDADRPLSVIEMMIDHDLIRFMPGHVFDANMPVERIT